MNTDKPLLITVAPNGARKTREDHPAIPLCSEELSGTAQQCLEAGAAMIHLHVRRDDLGHTLDVERYRHATAAIRRQVGNDIIVQITTEAVGIYVAEQQMQVVRELKPEAVSLSVRELCAQESDEKAAEKFFHWLLRENIAPQYILYSAADVARFDQLRQRGIIPDAHESVLYVLGRYSESQNSLPADLLPMLAASDETVTWSVCAFGASELSCMLTAAGLGGHCRVGFENNMNLVSGAVAPDNAALVSQLAACAPMVGRGIMSVDEARKMLGIK